jgi:hypothetical protein
MLGGSGSTAPASSVAAPSVGGANPNEVSNQFLDAVKANGIQNPVALAAIGATGERESGWSPKRINATWADPSESGQAGTSGGLMSWRAERLDNLRKFAAANGETGLGSPQTQARFFVSESPQLVQRLNTAKTPQEAMLAMNDAWRFAGYNRPGGERDARLSAAEAWAARMGRAPNIASTPEMAGPIGNAPEMPADSTMAQPMPDRPMTASPAAVASPAPVAPNPATQQVAQANPQLLQAAMARMNDPYASPGSRAVAQALVQRLVTQETKDPRDSRLKDLSIAEKEAALTNQSQMTPLQRRQAELAVQKSERELAGEGASPLTPEERKSIGIPEGQPAYKTRSGEIKFGPAGTRVNVDASQKTESEFGKETGKALAKRFDQLASDGDEAAQNLELVGEMRRLGGRIDTGAGAAVKSYLGKIGVKTEGVSDIEAFNTLINRLTPQQRVPGSGATSDFDAKMFRESLPSLMNTPEGNAKILETIERISTNKIARGEVAMRVQMGELTPKQGLDEIRKLQAEARSISDQFKPAQKQQSPGNLAPSTPEPGKVLRYNPQTGEFE